MSRTNSSRRAREVDAHLDQGFLAYTGLSSDAVHKILLSMDTTGRTFADAALDLGLMTQGEIDKAYAQAFDSEGDEERPTIIESALRKASAGRQVILRRGAEVKPGPRLQPVLDPLNPRGEELRALRTQLLLLSEASRTGTVLTVVSPRAGDGRSQLAADLALSFAQLGKRTLLVDADMRRPQLHSMFGADGQIGLADAIAYPAEPFLHPVKDFTEMYFLAAGHAVQTNPLELLSADRFGRIVEQWRNTYAYVVIDTPPISEYADALAVATLAGSALVLTRAESTTFKNFREMMRRLSVTQCHLLGAVINHF